MAARSPALESAPAVTATAPSGHWPRHLGRPVAGPSSLSCALRASAHSGDHRILGCVPGALGSRACAAGITPPGPGSRRHQGAAPSARSPRLTHRLLPRPRRALQAFTEIPGCVGRSPRGPHLPVTPGSWRLRCPPAALPGFPAERLSLRKDPVRILKVPASPGGSPVPRLSSPPRGAPPHLILFLFLFFSTSLPC